MQAKQNEDNIFDVLSDDEHPIPDKELFTQYIIQAMLVFMDKKEELTSFLADHFQDCVYYHMLTEERRYEYIKIIQEGSKLLT